MNEFFKPQRYQAAWGEIGARLQSRQTVGVVYMTAAITILGLAIGSPLGNPSQYAWRLPFVVVLPILSFAVAKWLRHNDAIIGLLSAYCASLEAANESPDVPAWHSPGHGFILAALDYRVWSDHAAIVVAVVGSIPAALHAVVGLGITIGENYPTLALIPRMPTFGVGQLSAPVLFACSFSSVAGILAIKVLLDNVVIRASFLHEYSFRKQSSADQLDQVWGFFKNSETAPKPEQWVKRLLAAFWISPGIPGTPKGYKDIQPPTAHQVTAVEKKESQ